MQLVFIIVVAIGLAIFVAQSIGNLLRR